MARFAHRDGEDAPAAISLGPVRDTVAIAEDGVFEVDDGRDDFDDVAERLVAAGHVPLEGDRPPDEPVEEGDTAENTPAASDFSEREIVEELDYREKQSIAAQYDHIDGNGSDDALTEALIKQRRDEEGE